MWSIEKLLEGSTTSIRQHQQHESTAKQQHQQRGQQNQLLPQQHQQKQQWQQLQQQRQLPQQQPQQLQYPHFDNHSTKHHHQQKFHKNLSNKSVLGFKSDSEKSKQENNLQEQQNWQAVNNTQCKIPKTENKSSHQESLKTQTECSNSFPTLKSRLKPTPPSTSGYNYVNIINRRYIINCAINKSNNISIINSNNTNINILTINSNNNNINNNSNNSSNGKNVTSANVPQTNKPSPMMSIKLPETPITTMTSSNTTPPPTTTSIEIRIMMMGKKSDCLKNPKQIGDGECDAADDFNAVADGNMAKDQNFNDDVLNYVISNDDVVDDADDKYCCTSNADACSDESEKQAAFKEPKYIRNEYDEEDVDDDVVVDDDDDKMLDVVGDDSDDSLDESNAQRSTSKTSSDVHLTGRQSCASQDDHSSATCRCKKDFENEFKTSDNNNFSIEPNLKCFKIDNDSDDSDCENDGKIDNNPKITRTNEIFPIPNLDQNKFNFFSSLLPHNLLPHVQTADKQCNLLLPVRKAGSKEEEEELRFSSACQAMQYRDGLLQLEQLQELFWMQQCKNQQIYQDYCNRKHPFSYQTQSDVFGIFPKNPLENLNNILDNLSTKTNLFTKLETNFNTINAAKKNKVGNDDQTFVNVTGACAVGHFGDKKESCRYDDDEDENDEDDDDDASADGGLKKLLLKTNFVQQQHRRWNYKHNQQQHNKQQHKKQQHNKQHRNIQLQQVERQPSLTQHNHHEKYNSAAFTRCMGGSPLPVLTENNGERTFESCSLSLPSLLSSVDGSVSTSTSTAAAAATAGQNVSTCSLNSKTILKTKFNNPTFVKKRKLVGSVFCEGGMRRQTGEDVADKWSFNGDDVTRTDKHANITNFSNKSKAGSYGTDTNIKKINILDNISSRDDDLSHRDYKLVTKSLSCRNDYEVKNKNKPTFNKSNVASKNDKIVVGGSFLTLKKHLIVCPSCHKLFNSSSALEIHERTHTGSRPFSCPTCNKSFTTKGNLKVHFSSVHKPGGQKSRRGQRLSLSPQRLHRVLSLLHSSKNAAAAGFKSKHFTDLSI
ncbi:hypothetical protein HELRODRAFT_181791 [Helobdella robusta]|uniref:C2H2-type domain-containing protein n=1 Tax=Helobdella robusta TaxID=6412 RepID=T1FHC1_HELRO|nr:hypothetical protein HELRODRAFT_181791 [Helobdella robusta]ESN92167.1 hypothetical protein HELRODRAFT_181791 [Helobdella robusta]